MSIKSKRTAAGERRYEVRLRDPDGREYSRTFRTRKEAERFEHAERAAQARGEWINPRTTEMTVAAWAEEWLASNPAKSPGSIARDRTILDRHILPAVGSRRLTSLTPRDIQALVTGWCGQVSPRTVRRHYDTIRAICNAAVQADLLVRSPCRSIRLPATETQRRPVLDAGHLDDLARAVGPDHGVMVLLAGVLGLRWGEVAGLKVRALDLLGRTLAVEEQRTRGIGGEMITRRPKSAAGRRTMSVPGWLVDELAFLLTRRHLTAADPDALIFVNRDGGGLDYAHWRLRTWLPATESADLAGLGFHDLRRTAATALVQEGVDLKTAQTRLGHADPRTTIGLYAQATGLADRAAAERLGERFRPPGPAATRAARGTHPQATGTDGPSTTSGQHFRGREGGIRTPGLSVPNAAR